MTHIWLQCHGGRDIMKFEVFAVLLLLLLLLLLILLLKSSPL